MCFLRPRSSLYACATMPLYMTSTPDNKTTEDLTWQVETSPKPKAKSGWKKACMCITHSMRALCYVPFWMQAAQEQSTNLIYSCPPPQSEHKKMPQNHKKATFNPTSGETLNELISKWWKKYSHVIHHQDTSRTLDLEEYEESLLTIAARILQVLAVIVTPEKDLSLPKKIFSEGLWHTRTWFLSKKAPAVLREA